MDRRPEVGHVHEDPLGPQRVDRAGRKARGGDVAGRPAQVGQIGRSTAGGGEDVGVAVEADDGGGGMVGGDPGGLQPEPAARVDEHAAAGRGGGPAQGRAHRDQPGQPVDRAQEPLTVVDRASVGR
ncbi:MAG: hypothetical protein L0H84_10800 [Pseudonocardia sp.]|nr:hypothetical protein [Pseudonocardia sp.]